MTKERREELMAACSAEDHGDSKFGGTMLGCDELRALLDADERLEAVREWAEARKHLHGHDDHYYRGVGAAVGAILDRIPATPEKEPKR